MPYTNKPENQTIFFMILSLLCVQISYFVSMDNKKEPLKINASIITIGDELLIGQVIDTNSPWMAQELNKIGIWLKRKVAVGDDREEIIRALDDESSVS